MVDQAGQDPVEVEPAADVAGDPAQRLGPMEQVGDLLLAADDADDGADRVGQRPSTRSRSAGPKRSPGAGHDEQRRPTGHRARGCRPRAPSRSPGRTVVVTRSLPRRPARAAAGRLAGPRRPRVVRRSSARPRTPNDRGRSSRRGRATPGGTATASRHEPLVAPLPDDDERPVAGVADVVGDAVEVLVEVVGRTARGRCASSSARSRRWRSAIGRPSSERARALGRTPVGLRPMAVAAGRRPATPGRRRRRRAALAARRPRGSAAGRRAGSAGRRAG